MATLTYEYPVGVTNTFKDGDYVKLKVFAYNVGDKPIYQYYSGKLTARQIYGGKYEWNVNIRNITLNKLIDGTDTMELTEPPKINTTTDEEYNIFNARNTGIGENQRANSGGKRSRRKRKSIKSRKSRR